MSNNKRRELLDRIHHACRAFQNAADEVDEAVCGQIEINRTDLRCLDILERLGPMTAGELATRSGLTTGATTTLIDRLERSGFAARSRDVGDRRKVLIDLTSRVRSMADQFYGGMAERWDALARQFSDDDLVAIATFLEAARSINAEHAAELRQAGVKPPSVA